MGRDGDFERWLERELRTVASVPGPSPRAEQSVYRAASRRATGSGVIAAVTSKGAAGFVVAALAVGVGGIAAWAATGSANPVSWGVQVVQVVQGCGGSQSTGQCVSSFAKQHGDARRDEAGQGPDGTGHQSGGPRNPTPAPSQNGPGNERSVQARPGPSPIQGAPEAGTQGNAPSPTGSPGTDDGQGRQKSAPYGPVHGRVRPTSSASPGG